MTMRFLFILTLFFHVLTDHNAKGDEIHEDDGKLMQLEFDQEVHIPLFSITSNRDNRELLEMEELIISSMSMSMNTEIERTTAIPPPSQQNTFKPTLLSSSSSSPVSTSSSHKSTIEGRCMGRPTLILNTILELELLYNTRTFVDGLEQALTKALSQKFSTCTNQMNILEPEYRKELVLSKVMVEEIKSRCSKKSSKHSVSCYVVETSVHFYGESVDKVPILQTLLKSIADESDLFHEELIKNGITSAKVANTSDSIESSISLPEVNANDGGVTMKMVVVICFSLLAVILIFAIAVRIICSSYRQHSMAFIPSYINLYETEICFEQENQFKSDGIDDDGYYSPSIPISAAYI